MWVLFREHFAFWMVAHGCISATILAGIHFEFLLSVCGESIYLVADNIRVICYENETITSTFGAQHSCWRCSSSHPSPRRWSLSISCVCGQFKVYFCTGRAKDAVAVSSQQKWMIDSMLSKSAKRANESNWVKSIRIWWRVVSMSMSTHQGFIHLSTRKMALIFGHSDLVRARNLFTYLS